MYALNEISHQQINSLLSEYLHNPDNIAHCGVVGLVAVDIGLRHILAGKSCDIEAVYVGGGLHDIGKERDPERHPYTGAEILKNEGLPKKVIEIVRKHGLEGHLRMNLEEETVAYTDFCIINTRWATVDERIKCLTNRYTQTGDQKKLNRLNNIIKKIKQIERNFVESWASNSYLNTYLYEVRRFRQLQE